METKGSGAVIALECYRMERKKLLERMAPLRSGRDTEIDMIEREMEGGVVVIQPLDGHIEVAQDVEVRGLDTTRWAAPKG